VKDQPRDRAFECRVFELNLYHFQADELSAAERLPLQEHLEGCESCARRLELEEELLRCLKLRLRTAAAPSELQGRVRSALHQARGVPGRRGSWVPLAAVAAAMLLLVLFVAGPSGQLGARATGLAREVTLVDLDCDRAGVSLDQQRRCNHPHHVNALRLANGEHWSLSLDGQDARLLAMRRDLRGHRLRIQGDFVPALRALRLRAVSDLGYP
jgi:anti-sigma factor (TIGR02949 family)